MEDAEISKRIDEYALGSVFEMMFLAETQSREHKQLIWEAANKLLAKWQPKVTEILRDMYQDLINTPYWSTSKSDK